MKMAHVHYYREVVVERKNGTLVKNKTKFIHVKCVCIAMYVRIRGYVYLTMASLPLEDR